MTAFRMRVSARQTRFLLLMLFGIWSHSNPSATALEPARGGIEFDRANVPANLPASWPKEIDRLVPVPRQEFISLVEQLNSANRSPRPAWLKSAHYEATLVNDTLRGGVMTASVQRLGGRSALLELGEFSFALEDLKWQNRPAIWGSSADGRVWLVADTANDELLGEWSCRGRTFSGGIDFDLQLPAATTSFLDLRVPRGYQVHVPGAEAAILSDVPTDENLLWRIPCGGDNHCHVTFVARDGLDTGRSTLMVEHDMKVVVREEDLRFQLFLSLESLDAAIQDLTLTIPDGVEIYSAVYGAETFIPIHRTPEAKADGRLSIRLPGPLTGRRRTLRIDGSADQRPGQPTIVPNIVVNNSTFDGGNLTVTVQAPLEVRSIRANGYRQSSTDVDSFTFQQLIAGAQLILDVHRASVSLSAQSQSVLDVADDSWNLTSEIAWNTLTGRAYQTSCLLPPGWEVTDVVLIGDKENPRTGPSTEPLRPLPEAPKLNWDVQSQSGGASILAIEFLEPIQLGQARSVRVLARRRPPLPGQSVPIPLIQLTNCDVSEMTLGIQIPGSMNPVISADSRLERIASPTSAIFAIPPEKANTELRWYRCDSVEAIGTLELRPRLLPIHVRTETIIEALPAEYRLRYSIQYEHREPQLDRLLVYLTEASPDIRWTYLGMQSLDLSAVQLAKSQHAEWNLPSKGELWEIRLPRSMGQSVTIEGLTNNRWSVNNRPALIFVPQAVEKIVELKLLKPESLELNLETDGLKSTGQRLSWFYATPQAEIDLALRNPEPSREFPLMVSMQLRTLMSADFEGFDVYRARFQVENGSAQESLRIKLDSNAVVQDVFVGGNLIIAAVQGSEIVIPGLSAARRDIVEVNYRVPARAGTLHERRRIVVPSPSAQVLGFFWEFSIPPSARIFAEPTGMRLSRALPSPTWNERLFGPLGRTRTETLFHPLRWESWKQLLVSRPAARSIGDMGDELVALHQAVAPDVPVELNVELWHATRIQLLTWISFGLCLTIGVVLRMIGWSHRDRLAAYGLAFAIAAVFSVSPPYVGFLGGGIAGMLIALLIPHHLLVQNATTAFLFAKNGRNRPGPLFGSLLGGLLLFGTLSQWDANSIAQELSKEDANPNRRPLVFVPVDENGQPSQTLPLVYVPPDALARWKALAGDHAIDPNYLISSARYQAGSMPDGNLNLTAAFRVHLLNFTDGSVSVALPLSDVSLLDAESCRVNGVPYPISALANGKGYSVELVGRLPAEPDVSPKAIDNGRPEIPVTTFDIELRSRKPRPQTPTIELRLPQVAKSYFSFSVPDPVSFCEIVGGRGLTESTNEGRSIVSHLGSTSNIRLRWGPSELPKKTAQVTASLLRHLELHSGYAELFFHLAATVHEGSVDSLELELPENAVMKRIQSRGEDLMRTDVVIGKNNERRLRLVFEKSQQTPITIDGSFVLLQSDSLAQTPLPKLSIVPSKIVSCRYDRNWWGVSTSSDFRLDAPNLDPETVNSISIESFLSAWAEVADPRHVESVAPPQPQNQPQFTFELHGGTTPTFTLAPRQSYRRAIQWKESGFIGKRRLEWTLVGEIETSHAATFQSVLLVDRRLRIENISVKENGAERLVRRTEFRADPSRIVLFLSDKTRGRQTITLQGSLPLVSGTPFVLPTVRPEDCETPDMRLALAHDPEIEVAFERPLEWKPLAPDESAFINPRTETSIGMGQFQITDSASRGKIQTSSRHSRCSCRSAVVMHRTEDSLWQLKYRLELTPEGESPLRMGLQVPAAIADVNSFTVERAEPLWHETRDGIRQLDLLLNQTEGPGTVVVQYETTLIEPKRQDWELPVPIPLYANSHESLLAVAPEAVWFPTGGREVRVADLPDWSADFYRDLAGSTSAFVVSGPQIEIQRDVAAADQREPVIRLLDQRVWLDSAGRSSGITQAFLSSVRNQLEFELPEEFSITSIFLDDHPLPLPAAVEGRLTIPLADAGTESLLTITWAVENSKIGLQQSQGKHFLWPHDVRVERNLVTLFPEATTKIWCRSGVTAVSSLDQSLDRLDTLLDRQAALGDDTRAAIVNRWLIHQLQSRLVALLPSEVENPNPVASERLKRWSLITEAINQLKPVPPTPSISWHARLLEGPATETKSAIRGIGNQEGTIVLWQFNGPVVLFVYSVLLGLLLVPLCRRLIRIEWSEWLHRHVAISWLLLATFWWLFLTPSAFGPVLLVLGLLRTSMVAKTAKAVAPR